MQGHSCCTWLPLLLLEGLTSPTASPLLAQQAMPSCLCLPEGTHRALAGAGAHSRESQSLRALGYQGSSLPPRPSPTPLAGPLLRAAFHNSKPRPASNPLAHWSGPRPRGAHLFRVTFMAEQGGWIRPLVCRSFKKLIYWRFTR